MYTIHSETHKRHATDWVSQHIPDFISREVPARAEVILAAVERHHLGPIIPPEDHGLEPILAAHDAAYVRHLQSVFREHARRTGRATPLLVGTEVTPRRASHIPDDFEALCAYYTYDYEEPILEGTWDAAYWSAQCALTAADRVRAGDRAAYALTRPPGHHATADQYGGFCYLNNVAIAARYLQSVNALAEPPRVAILDVDYHHGNGTQAIFYADPTVLFCSLHADPDADYPFYWGRASERGAGAGLGTTINVPLPLGMGDADYLHALDRVLALIADFAPRTLLVSLGLDTVEGDLIGKFHVTPGGFAEVGRRVAALGLPTIVVQEGGYRLETLGEDVVAFLKAFL